MAVPSEHYTHGHHESVLRSHSWRTVENSAAYLAPCLSSGTTVLDVGCGPGTITIDMAAMVSPARVVGIDASAEIIARATELAAERDIDNVEFVVGNAYELDYEDQSFDVVHAHQVLQHLSDPVRLLRELRRVRAADGVVGARDVDYGACFWYPTSIGLDRWLELVRAVYRSNGTEPDAGRRLKSWAMDAGFADVVSTASVWAFNSEADREWWGSMWETRILQSALAVDAIDAGLATQDELIDISRAWRDWINEPDGWLAMPHGEILCRG
ncbi:MAG: class I SAM-dependent methyltransferase [Cryobacterium sp.]|jgi:2-polyprenyl-3-methyl-5-hydroxy-6-metoxy-1,4-benzoquinol methylase|nr:class I SAM-dependent methyltransferase [Cryobacterium sp.]